LNENIISLFTYHYITFPFLMNEILLILLILLVFIFMFTQNKFIVKCQNYITWYLNFYNLKTLTSALSFSFGTLEFYLIHKFIMS